MKRRNFLQSSALVSAPLFFGGVKLFASNTMGNDAMAKMAMVAAGCGKILVIVQLNGGNDGLNTYFPLDKWSELSNARSNMLMNQSSVLGLSGNNLLGLHPAMTALRDLYNDGQLMVVQGVSYPNPNYSHFRATDIWFTASDSNVDLSTGWLGRSLDNQYPGYPTGYPNTSMPDPLAIAIGSTLPLSLQGPNVNMGYNVPGNLSITNIVNNTTDPAPNSDYGTELTFLRMMKTQSNAYRDRIINSYNAGSTNATYPTQSSLADSLKVVARLIAGGLTTPIYILNHQSSFDTHSNQVDSSDKTRGIHAVMLGAFSDAIGAFQKDLKASGNEAKVTGMTHSEFGRRIKSNASLGTDHGMASPVLFFGAALNTSPAGLNTTTHQYTGMIGTSPLLPANATVSDQVPMQFDFRQLYASVMEHWFCMSAADTNAILGSAFSRLPIFVSDAVPTATGITLTAQYIGGQTQISFTAQGNPAYSKFLVEFSTDGNNFSTIETISNVSLNASQSYSTTHTVRADRLFYRIRGVKRSTGSDLSNVVEITTITNQPLSVYPNPITDFNVHVEFYEKPTTPVDVTIYSMTGERVFYQRFTNVDRHLNFRSIPVARSAHYILSIAFNNKTENEEIMFR